MKRRLAPLALRRLALAVPMLFAVATAAFLLVHVVPGNPAVVMAGAASSKAEIANISHEIGTDRPLLDQYGSYLWGLVHLNFGMSISTGHRVASDLATRLPSTLELIVLALIVAVGIGVPAGTWAARHRTRSPDRSVRVLSFLLISTPDFWLGLIFIYFFFFRLGWAPEPIGQISPSLLPPRDVTGAALLDSVLSWNGADFADSFGHAVLPVLTLGLVYAAPISRLARSACIEAIDSDYVRFATACGLRPRLVRRYVLRGVLPPIATFAGILFTGLLGGAVLIETVFAWGGAAQYVVTAVTASDYPAVQGFVVVAGLISVLVFLVVDLVYLAIDPRVTL